MDIKLLRKQAKTLTPIARIGKSGVTQGLLGELGRQMKKKKIIKIKLLRAFTDQADKKKAAQELAFRLRAVVVQEIGNTITLAKKEQIKEKI